MRLARIQRRGALPVLLAGTALLVAAWILEPDAYGLAVWLVGPLQIGWGALGLALPRRGDEPPAAPALCAALVLFGAWAFVRLAAIGWA